VWIGPASPDASVLKELRRTLIINVEGIAFTNFNLSDYFQTELFLDIFCRYRYCTAIKYHLTLQFLYTVVRFASLLVPTKFFTYVKNAEIQLNWQQKKFIRALSNFLLQIYYKVHAWHLYLGIHIVRCIEFMFFFTCKKQIFRKEDIPSRFSSSLRPASSMVRYSTLHSNILQWVGSIASQWLYWHIQRSVVLSVIG
jgi:hypothetical protein